MKLRNKKTGEVVILIDHIFDNYKSLTELNEEWECYEEPKIKKYWWISPLDCGAIEDDLKWNESEYDDEIDKFNVEIGNYFETREEAEKAVEKLKAWKRLKDKGFKFDGWYGGSRIIQFRITSLDEDGDCLPHFVDNDTANDLDLLFGGEE